MNLADLRTDVVILTCAISAGIHAALVPDHFREGTGAGIGFVVATAVLHMIGIGTGVFANRLPVHFVARAAGGAIAVAGVALLVMQH